MAEPSRDPARAAALQVLRAVREESAYANLALATVLAELGLSGRDAALATELAAGTLRRQRTWDFVIDGLLTKPKLQPIVRDVLRLGMHQLFAMRVPTHAAISTSVDLVRREVGRGPTGLVNAVLRRASEHDLQHWLATEAATLGITESHPDWIVAALGEALGDRSDELPDLLAADNESPAVCLVALPGLATTAELPGESGRWSPYAVTLAGGDPHAIEAVRENRARVQDEGSQLVALSLAEAPLEGPDERWLDLCAGPGGKAALLAALAEQRGARLVANEVQPHRVELVRRALKGSAGNLRPGVEAVTDVDGTATGWPEASFDRVLVDAPCSGLGALRRRPEARWRKQASDLPGLQGLQRALLAEALRLTRPGGVVAYATCSPVLGETAEVVRQVINAPQPSAELISCPSPLNDAAGPLPETWQSWPHRHGTDAMFVALLRRM